MKKSFSILLLGTALFISACSGHRSCDFTYCAAEQDSGAIATCTGKQPINFALNSSTLNMADKENLDKVAQYLKKHPHKNVKIIGYTDSTGSNAYNKTLSERRAKSAANYLMALGIATDRISTEGAGATNFVASNNTESGRAQNRRIEITYWK